MSQKRQTEQARRRGRILLVDRHALMRCAAAGWIEHCPGLEVCGMASGTAQAFRAVKRFHPDVVVSEIMQPHDLGFIRELHRREPGLRILVFSMRDEAQYGAQARAAGAAGYVMKEAGGENLVRNICSVLRGRPNGSAGTCLMKATAKTPARRGRRQPRWRILIVNGTKAWCDALNSRISRYPGLQVCGEALGEQAGLEKVSRLRPSLLLTEIVRAQDLGFIREVHRQHRRLPILVLSFRDEEAYAPLALQAGARGYLMKGVDGDTLVKGIRKALNGQMVLSPFMRRRLGRHGH